MKKIFLIGGGGHCKSCIDVIEQTGKFQIEGIFDLKEKIGTTVLGHKVIGSDEDIKKYKSENHYFLVTIGQIKTSEPRMKAFDREGIQFATVISPRAYVAKSAKIGVGTIIMHDALINAGAKIGKNCIINSKSLIEHDSVIGNHCHISTSVNINGECQIGSEVFIGSGTVLKERTIIESKNVISFGGRV